MKKLLLFIYNIYLYCIKQVLQNKVAKYEEVVKELLEERKMWETKLRKYGTTVGIATKLLSINESLEVYNKFINKYKI